MKNKRDETLKELVEKNVEFQQKNKKTLAQHVKGQSPKIAILTCADSRVIPEFIFNASIGELFVVRVAGNIAVDETVIASLEYAVDHLHISHLIILAHTHCGAVNAAEQAENGSPSLLLSEIQESFSLNENHILANLQRQLTLLPQRSKSITKALDKKSLKLIGALYHLNDGRVDFVDYNEEK